MRGRSPLVVALNPSIDAEWRVDRVVWEEKNLVRSDRRWAGGKGVNVARWLNHLGCRARLLIPLGGPTGRELARQLHDESLPAAIVPLREATRVNVIISTNQGRQLRFNPDGPKVSPQDWRRFLNAFRLRLAWSSCLVLSGSLPRGVNADAYATLIRIARRAGVPSVLDCDGTAFVAAIRAKPILVKPNEHELAQWCRRPVRTETEACQAARELAAMTGGWVLVSRGGKRAILINVSERQRFFGTPPKVTPLNTVGAGDALLAGVVSQLVRGVLPRAWLRWGLAAGTAATQSLAGRLPGLAAVRRVAGAILVVHRRSP